MTFSFKAQQRGGTVLGLIIGALVGLGAALAVAVYVTKVPVPFLNKTPSKAADSDAAEAKKNKNWDPNVPLAGKPSARSAAGSTGVVGGPATPGAAGAPDAPDAPDAPPVAPAAPPVVAKPKVSADPLGDLAKAKADAKADAKISAKADAKPDAKTDSKGDASSGSGADPFSYFVQAGAFRTPEDAEQQRARLVLLGFQARVTEREQAGRTVYRVRLGPFDKKDDADRNKEKLDNNGVETALVRVQR